MTQPLDLSTDVLVIGGGPAGTWAALRARRAGADVVLVDKGYCGTSGATAPSGTGVWYVAPDRSAREQAKASREALGGYLADHRWMDRVLDQTYGSSTTRRRWSSSMATGRCASPRDTSAGSTATIAAASARRGARRADVIDLHRELGVAQASVLSARRDDDSDRVPA